MRHLFLLFLFLLAPLAPLHSAQEPLDAAGVNVIRSVAEQGAAEYQLMLGFLYDKGHGVEQDYIEARKWWLKAAEQGSADAQLFLGRLYYYGHGVAQDYEEAQTWYLKAAEQGYALAQCSLGVLYFYGHGVAQDYEEARKWYLKAAEQGDALAQYSLGRISQLGTVLRRTTPWPTFGTTSPPPKATPRQRKTATLLPQSSILLPFPRLRNFQRSTSNATSSRSSSRQGYGIMPLITHRPGGRGQPGPGRQRKPGREYRPGVSSLIGPPAPPGARAL